MTGNDQQSVWEHHLGVGTVIVGPRRVWRLCASLSGPAALHPVPWGGAAMTFWKVVPEREAKKQVSKKLRLRLARGVEINSVTNWYKREWEWNRSIEFSKSVRDWKPTKFWVDPPELFPTKNMFVFLKKSVWKQNGRKMSRKFSENVENHWFSWHFRRKLWKINENRTKNMCFRSGNRYLRVTFLENRPGDGEKYVGWHGDVFSAFKTQFYVFWVRKYWKSLNLVTFPYI